MDIEKVYRYVASPENMSNVPSGVYAGICRKKIFLKLKCVKQKKILIWLLYAKDG